MKPVIFKIVCILCALIMLCGCSKQIANTSTEGEQILNAEGLKQYEKNSVRITYEDYAAAELPIGISKIGGNPDLPRDFEWYYYEGESFEGIQKNRPLSFLAQINCEEAKEYDAENLLPAQGMLYFFYEIDTMTWGFDPKDKGSARVYYYSGDISDIVKTDFPEDLPGSNQLPERKISFSAEKELPDFEELVQRSSGISYDKQEQYDALREGMIPPPEGKINKLLGYANLEQGSMLLECAQVTSGIYSGEPIELPEADMEKLQQEAKQWQLLFQLDSIETEGYEMLWGDLGKLYFFIREDDLRQLKFDDCWLVLQCG